MPSIRVPTMAIPATPKPDLSIESANLYHVEEALTQFLQAVQYESEGEEDEDGDWVDGDIYEGISALHYHDTQTYKVLNFFTYNIMCEMRYKRHINTWQLALGSFALPAPSPDIVNMDIASKLLYAATLFKAPSGAAPTVDEIQAAIKWVQDFLKPPTYDKNNDKERFW